MYCQARSNLEYVLNFLVLPNVTHYPENPLLYSKPSYVTAFKAVCVVDYLVK